MKAGIINFYKPTGMTSQTAVNIVKRLTGAKKAGHCGTLDPLACGVLPIMLDNAVKASEYLTDHDKTYIAGIKLGITTDSGDITGNTLSVYEGDHPSFEEFAKAAKSFVGEQMQVPPMYSALKRDGKKLVDLARQGITVEREARKITVYSLTPFQKENEFFMTVSCSRGTYIRTLCEDIGAALGCGATMSFLERAVVGSFCKEDSFTEEDIKNGRYVLTPVESIFPFPELRLPEFYDRLFANGQAIQTKKLGLDAEAGETFKVYGKDGFYAIGEIAEKDGEKALKIKKIFFPYQI
ncbi:MAG: tRNA pseudouridine(55) synthase TruB [Clostridia bacterium]|nr:tRNA pseudouridine(55) synthase TruB [Clostridia bacterium]